MLFVLLILSLTQVCLSFVFSMHGKNSLLSQTLVHRNLRPAMISSGIETESSSKRYERLGVLLLNLGGPEKQEVQPHALNY
jgi:hypothetical protein